MPRRIDHALWDRLFARTAATGRSLQTRLREMVVTAVREGWLSPQSPLPSSRELAECLGVARNTVLLAYQQLVDEELLEARERSGYFVPTHARVNRSEGRATSVEAGGPVWGERLVLHPAAQRNLHKPADWLSYPYPFLYGQFDPALFPTTDWRECARQALSVLEIRGWAPDLVAADDPELVEQIRTRLLPRRGIWATADQIMVTLGAQQALYLLAELLIAPGTVVGMEDPGYPDARNIFALKRAALRPLPIDAQGLVPSAVPADCRLVFVTPMRQCPTGAILALERRHELIALAKERDTVIIEDDYESNFGFFVDVDKMPSTLRSLDGSGHVLHVGSLSKTLAPGLRLGYLVAPAELITELRALRRLMMRHIPANNQRALALFLALGHHDRVLRRYASVMRERVAVMQKALVRHLPEVSHSARAGSSSFWIHGPAGLNCRTLADRAQAAGILIEPGDVFFLNETPPLDRFRLGFSAITTDRIEPGIQALAQVVRQSA